MEPHEVDLDDNDAPRCQTPSEGRVHVWVTEGDPTPATPCQCGEHTWQGMDDLAACLAILKATP